MLLMGEGYEQVYIQFVCWVCGCYGVCDFSFWFVCEVCVLLLMVWLFMLMGLLFIYVGCWLGVVLLVWGCMCELCSVGFVLVFVLLFFVCVFMVLMGLGDEQVFLCSLFGVGLIVWVLVVLLVVLICVLFIFIVVLKLVFWWCVVWIVVLCLLFMLVQGIWVCLLMNGLFICGVGVEFFIVGLFVFIVVNVVVVVVVLVFVVCWLLFVEVGMLLVVKVCI